MQPTPVYYHKNKYEIIFPREVFERKMILTFFDTYKFNGFKYVKLIKQYLTQIKPLRYLILPLKELIHRSKLSISHVIKKMNDFSRIVLERRNEFLFSFAHDNKLLTGN